MPAVLHGSGCNLGTGMGCPLVVHCWADLQSVHELRCYANITQMRNVSEYMLVLTLCLVLFAFVVLSFFSTKPKDWMERMCLNDLFCVEWDEKLNTVSQPCKAKNCHNTAVLDENLGSCTHPFTNHGQIWHVGVDPQCTVPHHISS